MATTYYADIQKLYVAYFNRPADYAGLVYWETVVENNKGNLASVSAAFAASTEYKNTYANKDAYGIVNAVYNNLFGHDADLAGLNYYAQNMLAGKTTIDKIVTEVAGGAQGTDATAYNNKVAAATAFTNSLDTAAKIVAYSGDAANAVAKVYLAGVTTDASLAAAITATALTNVQNTISGTVNVGTTQVFTTGLDVLNGGAGNDLFVGGVSTNVNSDVNTLSGLDIVNGGAGVDTLRVQTDSANSITLPQLNAVEIVEVQGSAGVTIDSSTATALTNLNVTKATGAVSATAAAATDIAVTLVTPTSTITTAGGKNVTVTATDVNATNAITVGTAAGGVVTNGAKGAVVVSSTAVAYDASSSAFTLGAINVNGGTSISVTQKATSSTAAAAADTSNVAVTEGAVNIIGDANTSTVNVKQDATVAAKNATFTTGGVTETASVKFTAITNGQTVIIAGLTFTATADMTAAQVASAFANLINGTLPTAGDTQGSGLNSLGKYTGAITGWTSGAASGDTVVFTSTTARTNVTDLAATGTGATGVAVTTTAGGAHNATATGGVMGVTAGVVSINDAGAAIKTVTLDGYNATGSAITAGGDQLATLNLSNGGSFSTTKAASTLAVNTTGVSGTVTVTSGAATLNLTSTGNNTAHLVSSGTTTLNVAGSGLVTATSSSLTSLTTLKVSGTAGVNFGSTNGNLSNLTSVDTTGTTGAVTVAIDGGKATYAGGAGADSVSLLAATTAISKAINLGDGTDRLDLTLLDATKLANTDAAVTLNGGAGTDTIALSAAAAGTLSSSAAFAAKFTAFEKLEVGQEAVNTTVTLSNLNNINYIVTKGATNGLTGATAPTAVVPTATQGATGVTESTTVGFAALPVGEFYTIGGRTVTATGGTATAADIATAFATGTTTNFAVVSGALANWTAGAANGTQVTFTSTTANTNVADVSITPSAGATAPAVATTQGVANVTESDVFVFNALTAGQSYTVAGRTVAAVAGATAAEVAAAFVSGTSTSNLTVSGALTGWTVNDNGNGSTADAQFVSTTSNVNVTDITSSVAGSNGGSLLTLDKLVANSTVQLDGVGNIAAVLADATGSADVINVVLNNASATNSSTTNLGTFTANKVETVNITSNNVASSGNVSNHTLTLADDSATKVTLTGAGHLTLNLDATTKSVATIDGSAATGNLTLTGSSDANAVAISLTGGSGNDILTSSGAKADVLIGGAGNDTLVAGTGSNTLTGGAGNDLFKIGLASTSVNAYATITDFAAGDLLQLTGVTSFRSAKISLGDTAVFQDYANAAVNASDVGTGGAAWFTFGGNTYVVADMGGTDSTTQGFMDTQDFIVKLTGTIDLSTASFNSTYGTIGLV